MGVNNQADFSGIAFVLKVVSVTVKQTNIPLLQYWNMVWAVQETNILRMDLQMLITVINSTLQS